MKRIIISSIFLLITTNFVFAQTTGKIVGKIIDKKTGEPLPFVNINSPFPLI